MKIAALSDIHSNVFALEAVIFDALKRSVDVMLNLGDILYGPIAPRATYDLLREHDFVTICGNQDRQISEATPEETEANPTLQFILNDLGGESLDWLKSLPFDRQLADDIYLCHGTPTSDQIYLIEDVGTGSPRVRPDSEMTELLAGNATEVIICGHTHIPRCVALSNNQLIVNPGSVGLPAYTDDEPVLHSMENFSPHASYAMLERNEAGWTVQQIKVAYDHQRSAAKASKHQRHDWAHFLTTGKAR